MGDIRPDAVGSQQLIFIDVEFVCVNRERVLNGCHGRQTGNYEVSG